MPLKRYEVLKGSVVVARREDDSDSPTIRCASTLTPQATASPSECQVTVYCSREQPHSSTGKSSSCSSQRRSTLS
jgi:hypothetical protein